MAAIGQDAVEWAFLLQRGPGIQANGRDQHRRRAPNALQTISRRLGRPKAPTVVNVSCISDPLLPFAAPA